MYQKKAETPQQLQEAEETQVKKSPWIQAWSDTVAGIRAYSQLMVLADLRDDGDYKLVVADLKGSIKVYMGTNVVYNEKLPDKPVALEFIYDSTKKPMIPFLAVASGSSVFYYQDFKPHMKYDLPMIQFTQEEKDIWKQLSQASEETMPQLCEQLFALRENGTEVSSLTIELLSFESIEDQYLFVKSSNWQTLQHQNFITCMSKVQKSLDEEKSVTLLVLGTENKELLILDQTGMAIKKSFKLRSVPVFIEITGQYDIEYKIYVACRDGKIYFFKNGVLQELEYRIDSKPVGMIKLEKTIVVAGMNSTLYSFYLKGKKNFGITMPAQITNICKMELRRTQTVQAVLVALDNGEIRLYNDKYLITSIKGDEIVSGMCLGVFGREEGCLIVHYKSGGLSAKILQRQANLTTSTIKPGPPPEQDMPLNIPKKTKLFVELAQREKEQCVAMHKQFQKDLCKLRLKTAETYIGLLSEGLAPMSYAQGSQIRLSAIVRACLISQANPLSVQYEGIGPVFKIKLQLQNLSKRPIMKTRVVLNFNENIYKLRNRNPFVAVMVPNLTYKIDVEVENIDATGAADLIRVFIFNAESTVPLITANLSMPLSEQNMENF